MVSQIQGYFMAADARAPGVYVGFTTDPFPPGTSVWANISLSQVDTLFANNAPAPMFRAEAYIHAWTTYNRDGSEVLQTGQGVTQNAVGVVNCARIFFLFSVVNARAIAQINVFRF